MERKNMAHTSTLLLVEAEVTLLGRCGLPSSAHAYQRFSHNSGNYYAARHSLRVSQLLLVNIPITPHAGRDPCVLLSSVEELVQ